MEESFARVETKYMLTLPQAEAIEKGLAQRGFQWMDFGCPTVQSLYFDTPDHLLIRQSLERPSYKEKLRLRAYGGPGALTQSFVEVKKKFNGVVYKRRAALPFREAYQGLLDGRLPDRSGQVGREAVWMIRRWGLIPAAVIAYDRDAWMHPGNANVRITFDRNLSFRNWTPDLNAPARNLPLTDPAQRLMEIKTDGTYPLWLARLLWETGARRVHYSKYGLAYTRWILGNERRNDPCSTAFSRGA